MKSEYHLEPYKDTKPEEKQAPAQGKQLKHGSKPSNGKLLWQAKVYKINQDESEALQEFHKICNEVFKRDKNSCSACFKTRYKLSQIGAFLTAHHIQPREAGGANELSNLIALCNKCHDAIESIGLKSKEEIYGYFTDEKKHWYRKESICVRWQEWVYGGKRRPY